VRLDHNYYSLRRALRARSGETTVCRVISCRRGDACVAPTSSLNRLAPLGRVCRRERGEQPPRGCSKRFRGSGSRFPVVTGAGPHPFPFRTRKLSLLPPMVLQRRLCGRVGHCREYLDQNAASRVAIGGIFLVRLRAYGLGRPRAVGSRSQDAGPRISADHTVPPVTEGPARSVTRVTGLEP
jgi:hypothetical protein